MKKKKTIPFEFAIEALEPIAPETRPMFGCTAVYVGDKIVLILRDKEAHREDNGVWIATDHAAHESLRVDFPSMRTIYLLGSKITAWQNLPVDSEDFEESVMKACALILRRDPRIGRVPKPRKGKKR